MTEVLAIPAARVLTLRNAALGETLERQILRDALGEAKPSAEEVRAYFEKFRSRFVRPEAIEVWRILVDSESRAKELIERLQSSEHPQKTWSLLAREASIDKATHFRKGHLGFVREDGTTDVPQVRVSRAIFAAAKALPNGSYTQTPVNEGENWAIIWRRAYRPEQRVPEQETQQQIERQLGTAKARAVLKQLLERLRAEAVTEYHPELLEALPAWTDEGIAVPKNAYTVHPADESPQPKKTDWGER